MADPKLADVVALPAGERFLTVTQLAELLGVTARTIRFYEDKGLISPERAGSTRIYTQRDRARMILILRGKRLGFSLREIRDYLDLYDMDPTQEKQNAHLLSHVRQRIEMLNDQREALDLSLIELREIEAAVLAALPQAGPGRGKKKSAKI